MARKKPVFYPRNEGDVPPYYDNANALLVGTVAVPSLATKYGIATAKMTKVTAHNGNLVPARNAATAAADAAQMATQSKDTEFETAKVDLLDVLDDINKHPDLDEADAEALGMRQAHTPPDPAKAKPKVSKVTLVITKIVLDWIKANWFGIKIFGSYDGVTWAELDSDTISPWEDKRLNKVNNVPENRFYKLVYIDKNNVPHGVESDTIKVVAEIYTI